jgi:hypothetical protein
LTIGTSLRLVAGLSLFGRGFLGELPSDPATDLVSTLCDGGEIEVVQVFVGTEDIPGEIASRNCLSRGSRVASVDEERNMVGPP